LAPAPNGETLPANTLPATPGRMQYMRSKWAHLGLGILLLAGGSLAVFRTAGGWKPAWQQPQVLAHQKADAQSFDPATGDPQISEAAKIHVYGALADGGSGQEGQAELQTPQESDSSASPLRDSSGAWDHVHSSPPGAPQHLLHRRFSVRTYREFEFVVPAHAVHPQLQGSYATLALGGDEARGAVSVQVLLLTDDELREFLRGDDADFHFATSASARGEISWTLDPTVMGPQKYHLVFRNSSTPPQLELADADFILSFQ